MTAAQPGRRWLTGHRSEIESLRLEIERLRAFSELRAKAQENMAQAMLAESAARAAEAVEGRIQLATQEAIAFAQAGLESHEAALRALGRRLAETERPVLPPEPFASGAFHIGEGEQEDGFQPVLVRHDSEEAFVATLADLPISPGGATQLSARNIVEFVPKEALVEKVLPHWRSRLAPEGELSIVTLDGPAWLADFASVPASFAELRRKLRAEGTSRPLRRLFDADELLHVLHDSGFAAALAPQVQPLSLKVTARAMA